MVIRVQQIRQAYLAKIVDATGASRLLPGLRQRRKQHGRQNGYDGYNDKQFNESEKNPMPSHDNLSDGFF